MNARPATPAAPRRAFTLVELLVATALIAVVLGASYAALRAGLEARRVVEPRADAFQSARVALRLLSADLRAACPLHRGPQFLGMQRRIGAIPADNLDFATHHYTPARPGQPDFCCVSWFVERDPATGETKLFRRRNPGFALDPLSGGAREEIVASGVRGFSAEYYDGFDWYEFWGDKDGEAKKASSFRERPNLTGLPTAVRITLELDPEATPPRNAGRDASAPQDAAAKAAPPLSFQAVVKLNLAALPSSQGNAPSGNAGPDANPNANPNPGAPGGPAQPR